VAPRARAGEEEGEGKEAEADGGRRDVDSPDLDRPHLGGSLQFLFVDKHFTGLVGPRHICISLLVFYRGSELLCLGWLISGLGIHRNALFFLVW
jgi:hypothetical protein